MLNEVIRTLRKRRGLTQEQLAEQLGISVMTVRRWEWGERTPDIKEVQKLSQVLGVPMTDLIEDTPETYTGNVRGERENITQEKNAGNLLVYERNGERMELPPTQESYEIFRQIASIIAQRETLHTVTA